MTTLKLFLVGLLCLAYSFPLNAADWPQWRGPHQDGISKEESLLKKWPEGGPKKLWTTDKAGMGYSSYSIVDGTIYTMGSIEDESYIMAFNDSDGTPKWKTKVGVKLENGWGGGPRGTPTVDGDKVYALAGKGMLICVKAKDGSEVWSVDLVKDFGGSVPNWGYSESVLVDGNKVICTPGGKQGAMIALDKLKGTLIWRAVDFKQPAQYSSIIATKLNGKHQYIQLTQKELVGVDSESGDVLWQTAWEGKVAVIPTPIIQNNEVYIASGYGIGCKKIAIDNNFGVKEVFRNKNMVNHHGGVIKVGDYLYGYGDGRGFVCQDFATGEVVWNEKTDAKKGAVAYADGMIYLQEEKTGTIKLIEATPKGWNLVSYFTLNPQTENRSPKGKIWTHPVICNGKLYLRDQEYISCYSISN